MKLDNIDKSIEYSINILQIDKLDEWAISQIIDLYKIKEDWKNATEYLKILFKIKDNIDKRIELLVNI